MSMKDEKEDIDNQLQRLQSDGQAGVWIGGTCRAGIVAGYEDSSQEIQSGETGGKSHIIRRDTALRLSDVRGSLCASI